jgi:hypothetical protein
VSLFTPTDGQTTTSLVAVNDWCSIYPTGNTTTPYVAQVTAVGAGVNGTITLSTTAKFGTAPTSNSGSRNAKTGGAWADLGMLASGVALNTGTITQSTQINIKAGTYANSTTSRTFALIGTTTTPIIWTGYKTSVGDQLNNATSVGGTDIPLITFGNAQMVVSGAHQWFQSIEVDSAFTNSANGVLNVTGSTCTFERFRAINSAANANSLAAQFGTNTVATACYFAATTTASSCVAVGGNDQIIGCIINGGIIGIKNTTNGLTIADTVMYGQAGDAIQATTAAMTISGVLIYSPGGNGIVWSGTPSGMCVVANCYFSTVNQASKAAINNNSGTATNLIRCVANRYYNCTANVLGLGDSPLIFDGGSSSSEAFIAPASQNFAINPAVMGVGYPGKFENTAVFQGYLYPGAVQPQAVAIPPPPIRSNTYFYIG